MKSPYDGLPEPEWDAKTRSLVSEHPLGAAYVRETVLRCWRYILETEIGVYRIGRDIIPKPQMVGFILHELLCLEVARHDPRTWRCDEGAADKDIVNMNDDRYSVEIKTSSHPTKVFGNRSYAQVSAGSKKSKAGYFLAINFEKFTGGRDPHITKIRFGWLDHDDWIGQRAQSGQQATIRTAAERHKLIEI